MKQMTFVLLLGISLTLFCGLTAQAQPNPDYVLTISGASGAPGGSVDLSVTVDNTAGVDLNGWSFGACHDSAALTLSPGSIIASADVLGALGFVDEGDYGFYQVNELVGQGWTVGVVIDLFGQIVLTPGSYEVNVATYELVGAPGSTSDVCFCGTLGGPPPVDVVVVIGGGTSVTPVTNCGTVEIIDLPPAFTYHAPTETVDYDGPTGVGSFSVGLSISEDPAGPLYPQDTQGFSMGIAHDSALLISIAWDVSPLATLLGLAGPGDIGFVGPANFTEGSTLGAVYDLFGQIVFAFVNEEVVAELSFDTVPGALAGTEPLPDTITDLTWSDALTPPGGSQPVANVVVVAGTSVGAVFDDGEITLHPTFAPPDTPFKRGNCNPDGIVNIADAIWILNQAFHAGPLGTCDEACDANGDGQSGQVDGQAAAITDAIWIIDYRFQGGAPPPAPGPVTCGTVVGVGLGTGCDSSICP